MAHTSILCNIGTMAACERRFPYLSSISYHCSRKLIMQHAMCTCEANLCNDASYLSFESEENKVIMSVQKGGIENGKGKLILLYGWWRPYCQRNGWANPHFAWSSNDNLEVKHTRTPTYQWQDDFDDFEREHTRNPDNQGQDENYHKASEIVSFMK